VASKAARRRAQREHERPRAQRRERPARNLAAARLKAHKTKVAFVVTAAAIFVAAMIFARISYAGHSKHRASTLNAPKRFLHVVAANRLRAGVVAPPQAPPSVTSAPS
jgi:hypothetical protein